MISFLLTREQMLSEHDAMVVGVPPDERALVRAFFSSHDVLVVGVPAGEGGTSGRSSGTAKVSSASEDALVVAASVGEGLMGALLLTRNLLPITRSLLKA
jgi:hypothetical protein